MRELQKRLDDGCADFAGAGTEEFTEHAAVCDETLWSVIWKPGMWRMMRYAA